MQPRFLVGAFLLFAGSACFTPVTVPLGSVDGGTGGGMSATGGGNAATGGGIASTGGGPATINCSTDGFCWDGSPYGGAFHGIWGANGDFVVAVGEGGVIATWNGTQWANSLSPTTKTLRAVWLASASLGWAVGDEGTLLRWDGTTWTSVVTGITRNLLAIHGSGDTVYFGGVEALFTLNPATGAQTEVQDVFPTTDSSRIYGAIAVASAAEVYVANTGDYGGLKRFDGTSWVNLTMQPGGPSGSDRVHSLSVCGTTLVATGIFSGETTNAWTRVNNSWSTIFSIPGLKNACLTNSDFLGFGPRWPNSGGLSDVEAVALGNPQNELIASRLGVNAAWVSGPRDAWLAGSNGLLVHWTGSPIAPTAVSKKTSQVFAFAADNVWAVRNENVLEQFDGSTWNPVLMPGLGDVTDLYSPSREEAWIVKFPSAVFHYVGGQWQEVTGFPPFTKWARGSAANDVWFSGGDGKITHWNGTSIQTTSVLASATRPMHVTATQRWIPTVSANGVGLTFRWDQGGWRTTTSGACRITGVGDDVYFTTFDTGNGRGAIHRWTGTQSSLVAPGVDCGVIVSTATAVYAMEGFVLKRLGVGSSTLTPVNLGTTEGLTSLTATVDGHVWAVTSGGGLLHLRP